LENWRNLQNEFECYFIADWHALSTNYADTGHIREFVRELLIDWLAAGIDPAKATVFVQSRIPEHAVLHLLLSMIVPVAWLERNPTYKEKQEEIKERDLSHTDFSAIRFSKQRISSPCRFRAVGKDQLPHLELTRELARRFNSLYKPVFPEPSSSHEVLESARHGWPEDEQELRQHDQPVRRRTGRATETQDDGH
jgi:tryptophanyl-tRNA synthetase